MELKNKLIDLHVGRGWVGHHIEDGCPCPQEPCGLVSIDKADPNCPQHKTTKTMRSMHTADDCPGAPDAEA